MRLLRSFRFIIIAITIQSCASNEIGDSKDVAQDKIYQSYSIDYKEGNASANIECQFRFAGRNGTTLVLNNPSQIQFDGDILKVDSSKGSGALYPTQKSISSFFGKHSFTFSTTDNKQYVNSFTFNNFKLVNIPSSINKSKTLNINFETAPLQSGDYIELRTVNSDSSFSVRHTDSDKGNTILISPKDLKRQNGKELSLEATLYRSASLQQVTSEGGRLEIKYALQPIKIGLEK